ncbi:uncharacterized protein LY89DRAFT_715426 [Mollisia scopiformis]|uniref:Large ribosomal subunit protein mL67 n=1 Tax=Mollisia scopiformis TaxID=149040 RepID=A0A194XLZ2_MOLSC|nr:uncharacterized protein LY89DRAFT_715426 [Mollisia scopiformis]KUJ21156.1 hypothetical protein LY89DRAFT_715426 [Mollisia scopiformis]
MSARTTSDVARKATRAIGKSKPSPTALGPRRKRDYGRQIFVFNHLQKNMIVYSLTKALRNNAALNQIPFNGKKTVPAALRKDLWHPFAQITFPEGKGFVGLSAFQKLREYRKRHELEWGDEIFLDKEGKHVNKEIRGRQICDQKANSVADMAAVLGRLALKDKPTPEIVNGRKIWPPRIGLKREGQGVNVQVLWRDLTDAEFAETWAENVEHGVLPMHTNHRDPNRVWGYGRMTGRTKEVEEQEIIPEVVSEQVVTEKEPEKVVL